MKKAVSILLVVVYTLLICGIRLQLHYCSGKLKNISLVEHHDKDCCCGNKKKNKDCCNEKALLIKVKDDQNSSKRVSLAVNYPQTVITVIPLYLFRVPIDLENSFALNYHKPPILHDNPLYLEHRIFLI